MNETQQIHCDSEGCPVLESGRCLEGFDPPSDCPHAVVGSPPASEGPEPSVADEDEASKVRSEEQHPREETIELGGAESLTVPLADQIATRYGAEVALVAGDFQSGKTTLIAELYGRFLRGLYEGWSFAGSDCLRALDGRYHGTREGSGLGHPDVPRTEDEEMRLVDFRIQRNGRRLSLMLSDIRGELFDSVVEGGPVKEVVPLAARADKVVVLADGEKIADNFKRDVVASWCKQLIGGLTETDGVRAGTQVAIVLSKADLVDEEHAQWFTKEAEEMKQLALERGLGSTEVFSLAARPDASPHEPLDLPPLFHWLVSTATVDAASPDSQGRQGRSFWSWRK
jgi:Double-GTPase 2